MKATKSRRALQAGARQRAWLEDENWAEGAESRLGKKAEENKQGLVKTAVFQSKVGGSLKNFRT